MTDIKKIEPLSPDVQGDTLINKMNELIRGYNSLISNLKPSVREPNENKGYENEEIENHRIEDPK